MIEISITTKKKKALKKLLNKNDTELETTIQKVIDDWTNNVISTKYQSSKSVDDLVDEINK